MTDTNKSRSENISRFSADFVPRISLLCVLIAASFSFTIPAIADVATAVLVLLAISSLIHDRSNHVSLPVILAGVWIVFVLGSAIYATALLLPGNHFKSLGKHLPIALGPLVAIPLSAACSRLQLKKDVLVALLFFGLIVGALFVTLSNGAVSLIIQGWSDTNHSFLGRVNRNFVALACGVSLIASVSLLHYLLLEVRRALSWRFPAAIVLILFIVFVGKILVLMQSRTAYLATAVGLAVWLAYLIATAFRRVETVRRRMDWVLPIVVAVVFVISMINLPIISQRFNSAAGLYVQIATDFVLGRPVQLAKFANDGADRLQIAVVAFDLLHQRPWLGWGPDASHLLEIFSPFPGIRNLSQFHNGYLQELVSFGFVGALLLAALLGYLIWSAFSSRTKGDPLGPLSPSLFSATLSLILYLLVTNITESILFVKPAAIICMIVASLPLIKSEVLVSEAGSLSLLKP